MPDRAGFGRATAPIRSASAAWRPSAIAPVPIAADSRNFLRETPRRPAMCVYLGPEPYKRDTRSTRRSQQVSFTCDLFTGSQPSAQWRSTTVSGGAVRAKAIGDCRLTAVYGPAERRALIDRVLHVQSRAALDQQPDDGLMTGRNSLMERRRVRVVALRVVPVGILSGVEQHADDVHVTVLRGQCERPMAVLAGRTGEELTRPVETAQSSGRGDVVYARAAADERLGRVPETKRQRRHQGRRPRAGAFRFERGAEIDEHVDERRLHARLRRRRAR